MNEIKRSIQNQATGLFPLLLFMLLNNFFSYKFSFIIAVLFCVVSLVLCRILSKDKGYLFLLLPASVTLMLYAVLLCLHLKPVLFTYSPVIIEVLLVVVITVIGFTKQTFVRRLRNSQTPACRKTMLRTALNEFYFLVRIIQSIYTLHLFVILFCTMLPKELCDESTRYFLYRYLGLILGIGIIGYEQIRLFLMQDSLKKEMWLPVLDDSGKVIGCMARSVSRTTAKKYCHPIVRVAVIYNGMLYLTKRNRKDYVSPDTLDYPFQQDVIFRQTIDAAVKEAVGEPAGDKDPEPHFMIRYIYENEKVKQLVSLFVLRPGTEEQFDKYRHFGGKLWTGKQIDENLGKGIYSGYFEEEYLYLKNTILLAENL